MSLQGEAGVGATGAGGVIVDHASLIRAEHPLTRPADDLGSARDDEAERRNGAVTCPRKAVAGLITLCKNIIDQTGLRRSGCRARICATQGG